MKHPVLDMVSDEQKALKKPWALISILAVFILFGTFWAFEKQKSVVSVEPIAVPQQKAKTSKADTQLAFEDITAMHAALANTAVLNYSSLF